MLAGDNQTLKAQSFSCNCTASKAQLPSYNCITLKAQASVAITQDLQLQFKTLGNRGSVADAYTRILTGELWLMLPGSARDTHDLTLHMTRSFRRQRARPLFMTRELLADNRPVAVIRARPTLAVTAQGTGILARELWLMHA